MRIVAAVRTHVGCVRWNNEDNYYLCGDYRSDTSLDEAALSWEGDDVARLFAVADGMGGEEKGELASLIAVEALRPARFDAIRETAMASIHQANEGICEEILKSGGRRAGSTLAALYLDEGKAICVNLGDSRVYCLRGDSLTKMSKDHNVAAALVENGTLTREEAERHRSRHELTQHLGLFESELILEPAVSDILPLQPGDLFLLCSDGLTDMLTENEIVQCLKKGEKPKEQAEILVQAALDHGGRDNVTVLVVAAGERRGQRFWRRLLEFRKNRAGRAG